MAAARPRKISDTPDVDFNLDTYELEKRKPFAFVLKGRRIELADPAELDWHLLADVDGPEELAEVCMTEADRKFFLAQPLAAGKLNELMLRFRRHSGMGTPGNADA